MGSATAIEFTMLACLAGQISRSPLAGKRSFCTDVSGTATLDAWYEPHQQVIDAMLRRNGYTRRNWMTRKFEGAEHNERAWRERLHLPLTFLLAKKRNRTIPGLWKQE